MYKDIKTNMDRIGRKLKASCDCHEEDKNKRTSLKHFMENMFEENPWDEAQREVDRENMRAINFNY